MSIVSTGLSESDRSHLIDASVDMLDKEALVIQLTRAHVSAHELLVEAAEVNICHLKISHIYTHRSRAHSGQLM